ncbi:hypothetical protein C5615_34245 [Burkholderia cepacia]|uniref:Uncharacterized protein n=1 Tax=Burkholderia cepacia TaxID=292 RepID=A0A2S8I593_BURCE|nr:hypothetical protein [Burkholderia cepacia]EKS9883377.1 hypothetical protein [Burkholderia pyrrocinia]EKS9893921.1 hypothetical protein [Burkholderia pyrrocinia]EKS9906257.1 hypothetical protein [Burkholderia pyrrocinia]PQP09855.1 hypothetical protein C5615_34245 [Burkholderia cepacia]HDR9511336.1 hypothetical protein [Burkholderia cepacia]
MTDGSMRIASGCVTSVSQKTISTQVWSNNLGWTTRSIEEIALQLDAFEAPLTLRTSATRSLFIVAGDRLDVAYTEGQDRLAIYGIRNVTDGSVYLVRPAKIAGARIDVFVTLFLLVALVFILGIMSAVSHGKGGMLDAAMWFAGGAIGLFLLSTMLRTVFGVIVWPEIRRLAQPGGKREMHAALDALSLAADDTRRIRFI